MHRGGCIVAVLQRPCTKNGTSIDNPSSTSKFKDLKDPTLESDLVVTCRSSTSSNYIKLESKWHAICWGCSVTCHNEIHDQTFPNNSKPGKQIFLPNGHSISEPTATGCFSNSRPSWGLNVGCFHLSSSFNVLRSFIVFVGVESSQVSCVLQAVLASQLLVDAFSDFSGSGGSSDLWFPDLYIVCWWIYKRTK